MLAGVTLGEAERAVGKERKTRTRDLVRGLSALGFTPGLRLKRVRVPLLELPAGCIVKVRWHGTRLTHWVVHERGTNFADPDRGWVQAADLAHAAEVLSYLPMRRAGRRCTVRQHADCAQRGRRCPACGVRS